MAELANSKPYDLEDRTCKFAKEVIAFTSQIKLSIANAEIIKQLVRSAGSVGANYIEANESLGKKDFALHIKICRKEAKESRYWISLLQIEDQAIETKRGLLEKESTELMKIFGSIIEETK